MSLDLICMWFIMAVGAVTGYRVQRRLGRIGWPLFLIFVLAADARLYWPKLWIIVGLKQIGWWEETAKSSLWNFLWTVLPAVLLTVLAFWLWHSVKGVQVNSGDDRSLSDQPTGAISRS